MIGFMYVHVHMCKRYVTLLTLTSPKLQITVSKPWILFRITLSMSKFLSQVIF